LWLADAVGADGRVTTLERLPAKVALAETELAEAGLSERVRIVEGDAADSLGNLEGEFDLVFLDANRARYVGYLPQLVGLLRSGGLLVIDNVTSHPDEMAEFLEPSALDRPGQRCDDAPDTDETERSPW
jgi:predicted O-methyltransferase YrrM